MAEGEEYGGAMGISKIFREQFPEFDIRTTILGHIQRGGSPSAFDRVTASRMGVAAIEALLDDQKSIMIGMVNNEMVHVPLNKTVKLHKDIDHKLLGLTEVLI